MLLSLSQLFEVVLSSLEADATYDAGGGEGFPTKKLSQLTKRCSSHGFIQLFQIASTWLKIYVSDQAVVLTFFPRMRNRLISQHILLTAVAAPAQKLLNKSLRVNLFVERRPLDVSS